MRTDILHPLRQQVVDTSKITSRNLVRKPSSDFGASLKAAASTEGTDGTAATSSGTTTTSTTTSTRSATSFSRVSGDRAVPPPVVPTPPKSTIVDTPIGVFDLKSTKRSVIDVDAASELEAYFMTHAPAEWYKDAKSRAAFSQIYGTAALAAVDSTSKVPKNMDPIWVASKSTTRSA
jgi:hypothetical protein